ncbi:MAG: NYN domain-containing protein [Elainellaceae cyanobacterium]
MARAGVLIGFGAIAFGLVAGVSWLVEREVKRSLLTGTVAMSAAYAGGLVTQTRPFQAGGQSRRKSRFGALWGSDDIAVFWDYENVRVATRGGKAPLAESLVNYSEHKGHTRFKMVYANWRREREPLVQALYSLGFEPIHVSTGKENSVDIKLTVDCLNTAHHYPNIQQFIIVTADRDFVPLVNALRTLRKRVTLIGRTETASEQLMLSADEFIDLEKLSTDSRYPATEDEQPLKQEISYSDAIACLTESINQARNQGKSTRFGAIDLLMRANPDFTYSGFQSIRHERMSFDNFSAFIAKAEADGAVKVQTLREFKELFLPDEDPELESEFSGDSAGEFTLEKWGIILDQICLAFDDGVPKRTYGRFLGIFSYVRQAKKDGRLDLTNAQLKQSLSRCIDVGVLTKQEDGTYCLAVDLEERREAYLSQLYHL